MNTFLVDADVESRETEEFLVEAETPLGATAFMLAWLGDHTTIRTRRGDWVRSCDVSRNLLTASQPSSGSSVVESYLHDGRPADHYGAS